MADGTLQHPVGRLQVVIQYRTFRNSDPPALVTIWNEAFTSRGAICMRGTSPLEYFVFAKPYFDPAGLILALDDATPVGFVHAGFGANQTENALASTDGITCLLGVRPPYRRRGIGSELLRRSEAYLRGRGAARLHVGGMRPLNPFYFGLYGGSESAGVLASEPAAEPFLLRSGYQATDGCLVFHRRLTTPLNVVDSRFAGLRRRYDVQAVLRTGTGTWWEECVLGPVEMLEFHLEDRATGTVVAQVGAWEMQGFGQRWNESAVGLTSIQVRPELRRQGMAKLLLAQVLKQIQEQYFTLVETQVPEQNTAAVNLIKGLGFQQVDTGKIYRKQPASA
jgi:ribosomal protein S18 acetylase RimI-like enzyme